MSSRILDIANASVRRAGKTILDNVSFSLEEGVHTAIIGPNGAGKSTLMGVMCKNVHPLAKDDYSYSLFGGPRWSVSDIRKVVGHVSQADSLLANTTYTSSRRQPIMYCKRSRTAHCILAVVLLPTVRS